MKVNKKCIDIHKFDYDKRKGQILYCVELITNDIDEITLEVWEYDTEKEAIKDCEYLNKFEVNSKYKYIQSNFEVGHNELLYIKKGHNMDKEKVLKFTIDKELGWIEE